MIATNMNIRHDAGVCGMQIDITGLHSFPRELVVRYFMFSAAGLNGHPVPPLLHTFEYIPDSEGFAVP